MSFDFRYPTPLPSTKGWGPGWPDCQPEANDGESIFWPGVHPEIAELVQLLVAEATNRGFLFLQPGCWGFGCRATKSSSGSQGGTPSFHSWGLGLDVNAPRNVYGADREDTELGQPDKAWFIQLFREYGFFWLGPAIGDWMHFSFCGSPADARAMTEKARRELGDVADEELREGIRAFLAGVEPADEGYARATYRALETAARRYAEHRHDQYARETHTHEGAGHSHTVTGTAT